MDVDQGSPAPDIATPNVVNAPAELARHARWVLWRYVKSESRSTWAKIPYQVSKAARGRSNDPSTWTTLERAVAALEPGWGLGFMFRSEDDIMGIDLDKAIDTDTGEVQAWALEIVQQLNSYTEVSPSGTGIHILVRARLGELPGRRRGSVEMYESGRYFTFTGRCIVNQGVEERQSEVQAVHARHIALQRVNDADQQSFGLNPSAGDVDEGIGGLYQGHGEHWEDGIFHSATEPEASRSALAAGATPGSGQMVDEDEVLDCRFTIFSSQEDASETLARNLGLLERFEHAPIGVVNPYTVRALRLGSVLDLRDGPDKLFLAHMLIEDLAQRMPYSHYRQSSVRLSIHANTEPDELPLDYWIAFDQLVRGGPDPFSDAGELREIRVESDDLLNGAVVAWNRKAELSELRLRPATVTVARGLAARIYRAHFNEFGGHWYDVEDAVYDGEYAISSDRRVVGVYRGPGLTTTLWFDRWENGWPVYSLGLHPENGNEEWAFDPASFDLTPMSGEPKHLWWTEPRLKPFD